jgi:hypothetical protein
VSANQKFVEGRTWYLLVSVNWFTQGLAFSYYRSQNSFVKLYADVYGGRVSYGSRVSARGG